MKSLTVLQGLKSLLKSQKPWTAYLLDESERVYRHDNVVRYSFEDGSMLSHSLEQNEWHAWSIYENLRGQGEIYQA